MEHVHHAHGIHQDPLYLRVYLTGLTSKGLVALAGAVTPVLDDGIAMWWSQSTPCTLLPAATSLPLGAPWHMWWDGLH